MLARASGRIQDAFRARASAVDATAAASERRRALADSARMPSDLVDRHDPRPARWREAPHPSLAFPYMVWAHTHTARTRCVLTQSGVPIADTQFLDVLGRMDLSHATAEALPAVEERLAERFGVARERVLVVPGASGGMHACAQTWFRAPSRVVADLPSYEPFRALPLVFGAELKPLARRLEDGWRIDPADVRQLLASGRGPGHVFLANPHNPTGAMLSRAEIAAIAAEAARTGGVLVSCEVYMEYVPRDRAVHAFEAAPNGVTIGSLTKAYGLGSLRMGWIVLGEGLVKERARVLDSIYLTHVDPPTPTLRAAAVALDRLDALLEPARRFARESRPIWERWLTSTEGVEATVPEHGIIAFPRLTGIDDTLAFCEELVRDHGVDVVPGEFFGLPGHVRVGCGTTPAVLEDGLARLSKGLQARRAR